MNPMTEEYLAHHGILGMKWGVRRYQNKDGSLTTAGRKRYLNEDGSLTPAGRKRMAKEQAKEEKKIKSLTTAQKAHTMTDEELNKAINRMRLEQQYVQLMPKEQVSTGKKFVNNLKENLTRDMAQLASQQAKKYTENLINKYTAQPSPKMDLNKILEKPLSEYTNKELDAIIDRVKKENIIYTRQTGYKK